MRRSCTISALGLGLGLLTSSGGGLGCSSGSDSSTGNASTEKMATQSGRVVAYVPCDTTKSPVAGAVVTVGAHSSLTGADGTYTIPVPIHQPFTMTVVKTTAPTYAPLTEAEDMVAADYSRGDTQLIDSSTAGLLSSALPNYDSTRGLLTIELVKTGACTDLGGSTVAVTPSDSATLTQYPSSCVTPVGNDPFVTDGIFPAAVVYNITPGVVSVEVKSTKCTQIPFPYTDPATGLTYDGKVTTKAGLGTSFLRVFMK